MHETVEEMVIDTFKSGFDDSLEDITRTILILLTKYKEQLMG